MVSERETTQFDSQSIGLGGEEEEDAASGDLELKEDPFLGVGGGGPVGTQVGLQQVPGLLRRRLTRGRLHPETQRHDAITPLRRRLPLRRRQRRRLHQLRLVSLPAPHSLASSPVKTEGLEQDDYPATVGLGFEVRNWTEAYSPFGLLYYKYAFD